MRKYPDLNYEYDKEDLKKLNVKQWQLDLLKLNPEYVYWGNYEDYMWRDDKGWESRCFLDSFKDMWELDEYNECVNFYFELYRENHRCPICNGQGLNESTLDLYNTWYKHLNYQNYSWSDKLEKEEVLALAKEGRLHNFYKGLHVYFDKERNKWKIHNYKKNKDFYVNRIKLPSPEEVNDFYRSGMGHDSINCWICVEARAKKLGVYGKCDNEGCDNGFIYDEEKGKVALQLWILHPRKGCSKGVYIKEVKKKDLLKIFDYLLEAKKRNSKRFSKIKKEKK